MKLRLSGVFTLILLLLSVSSLAQVKKPAPLQPSLYDGCVVNKAVLGVAENLLRGGAIGRDGGSGSTGSDIIILGDSLSWGTAASTPFWDGWVHRYKKKIQAEMNPAGVTGGYGFMRVGTFSGGTPTAGPTGPLIIQNSLLEVTSAGAEPVGGLIDALGSNATAYTNCVAIKFAGSGGADITNRRVGVTQVDLLYSEGSAGLFTGNAGWRWTTTDPTNAAGVTSAITASATALNTATGTNQLNRVRVSGGSAVSATTDYWLLVGCGTSGNLYFPGVIAYNGDVDRGVRVHNLATPGRTAYECARYGAAGAMDRAVNFWASSTRFAGNPCLWIISFGQNEVVTPTGDNTPANFELNMRALIRRIVDLEPTNPKVLLVIPPWRCDNATYWSRARGSGHPLDYHDVYYKLAAEFPNDVALLDLPKYFGCDYSKLNSSWFETYLLSTDGRWPSLVAPGATDYVHWSNAAQEMLAGVMMDLTARAHLVFKPGDLAAMPMAADGNALMAACKSARHEAGNLRVRRATRIAAR